MAYAITLPWTSASPSGGAAKATAPPASSKMPSSTTCGGASGWVEAGNLGSPLGSWMQLYARQSQLVQYDGKLPKAFPLRSGGSRHRDASSPAACRHSKPAAPAQTLKVAPASASASSEDCVDLIEMFVAVIGTKEVAFVFCADQLKELRWIHFETLIECLDRALKGRSQLRH